MKKAYSIFFLPDHGQDQPPVEDREVPLLQHRRPPRPRLHHVKDCETRAEVIKVETRLIQSQLLNRFVFPEGRGRFPSAVTIAFAASLLEKVVFFEPLIFSCWNKP